MSKFDHLFKFVMPKAAPPQPDPFAEDKALAQQVLDFSQTPYRHRLDAQLDAMLTEAFAKKELEKAGGIQCVRDFLRRDLDDARRSMNE